MEYVYKQINNISSDIKTMLNKKKSDEKQK